MRVVFDSNIYMAAFAFPGGQAEKAVLKVIDSNITLLISKEIIDETLTVLSRKFGRDPEFLSRTAVYLSEIAVLMKPARKLKIFEDEPDNRILECAIAGVADFIITGDKAMLKLGEYKSIRIIGLREFLSS